MIVLVRLCNVVVNPTKCIKDKIVDIKVLEIEDDGDCDYLILDIYIFLLFF